MVVGRLLSCWEDDFSGAMLNFGGVIAELKSGRIYRNEEIFQWSSSIHSEDFVYFVYQISHPQVLMFLLFVKPVMGS